MRYRAASFLAFLILFALLTLSLIPLAIMVVRSFKELYQVVESPIFLTLPLHWENYAKAWELVRQFILNTIGLAIATVVGTLFFSSLTAYVFARYAFPGKDALFSVLIALLMIPQVIGFVPSIAFVLKTLRLNNNWLGVLFPYWASGQALAIYLLRSFFERLPEEIYESARLDGAGHLALYCSLTLPLSGSILSVIAILNVINAWNDYVWPSIVLADPRKTTIAVGLVFLRDAANPQPGVEMAAYVIASIPMFILFLATMKTFVRGIQSGAIKA